MIEIEQIVDGGVYWKNESILWPDDENNWSRNIIFTKEVGQYKSDKIHWTTSTKEEREMEWNGNKLIFKE